VLPLGGTLTLRQAASLQDGGRQAANYLFVIEAVASGLSDPALRETLPASPQVAALREAAP
jgi:hypothetical protein